MSLSRAGGKMAVGRGAACADPRGNVSLRRGGEPYVAQERGGGSDAISRSGYKQFQELGIYPEKWQSSEQRSSQSGQ